MGHYLLFVVVLVWNIWKDYCTVGCRWSSSKSVNCSLIPSAYDEPIRKDIVYLTFTKSCLQRICCSLFVCNVIMLTTKYFISMLYKDVCNLSFVFYPHTVKFTIFWWHVLICCYCWHLSVWADVMC